MLDKITFVNGTIVTSDYLNEVQKGTDFSGASPRADYYSVTSDDHNTWNVSQRDKLKDYEIANPREEQETAIGRLAHDGIIMGYTGVATAGWVLNDSTFSEPKCLPIAIGDNNSISVVETSQTHGVIVEAGKITLSDGTVGTWPRQIVGLIDETGQAFIYANEVRVAGVLAVQITISSTLPSPESNAYVPLAEINTTNGAFNADAEGNVMGTGVKDLRPNLYVGALNNYSSGVLKNTDILNQNTALNGWDRAIVDTRNGSVIITLPTTSSDNDRVAIVDLEGSFDRYPVVVRPSGTDKINNSVDDWIINIRDAHIELFYHEATSEWRFEETPGSECNPKLGTFLSCGGKEFIGVRTAGECPDGQPIPGVYPNPSEGLYRFEAASGKCYKEVNSATAIYSNGEGGLIKVFGASRCIKVGAGGISAGAEITKNIIYVDPATGDDQLINNGTSQDNPFRTIERALLEAARSSRRPVGLDAYDTTVIELAPGDYYVDNSPGLNAVGGPVPGEAYIKQVSTSFTALNSWSPELPYITIKANDSANLQPPALFNLGRTLYTRSGAVGTIYKIEKDAIASSIWRVYLQYVQGGFNVGEELLVNRLSDYNPTSGGLIVPRGISINGVDLRKVRVRPMYVPQLTPGSDTAQAEKTYIFKVTGGTYISLITFTDNQQFSRTHNTVTAIGYASEAEIKGVGETSYYTKIQSLFGGIDNWGVEKTIAAVSAETTIVAPLASSKEDRSQDREENQTGVASPDFQLNVKPSFPGPALLSASEGGTTNYFQLPDVNSTRSSSPYVFNCSVRSIFGLNGMWIDGSRVSGFKSMVSANYTQVSLQTDPDCFESPSVEYYEDPPRNKEEDGGKRYRACAADEFKYRHFGFRASFDAQVQLVSCFVIGNADHFISETGSDLSITNSCSDFGDISLRAIGYKGAAFSQDGAVQKGTYLGTKITEIIPPIPLSYNRLSDGRDPTLEDISVNTGIVIDYEQTLKYVLGASSEEETPSPMRIYVRNSNSQNPYTLNNPPSASDIGLGQFSYTRKVAEGAWELAGGAARGNRNRIYINGFAREGDAVLYTGDLKVGSSDTTPGFDKLDDRSKVFTWDETAADTDADGNIINQGYWYFEVDTTNVQEETLDTDGDGYLLKKFDFAFKFKVKTPTTIAEEVNQSLDFIFDKSPIKIIRGADRRIEKERVYKLVFDGFLRTEGVRRPQAYYILEKQPGVTGGAINTGDDLASDPLVVTQVQTYNSYYGINADSTEGRSNDGKFIGYVTQGSVAREVFTGDFIPTLDADEPELTEDPSSSITKIALSLMQTRPGIHYSVGALGPNVAPIQIGTTQSAPAGGFLIETRRPSVIRASGHTWEWTGYLNYDTSFPAFQGDPLEQDFALGKIIVEEKAGRVYATGMNEEGSYYLGTTVFDLRSGEQFSIPLKADNEIGGVTNQVLNNVVIKGTLLMQEDSQMVFGDKTKVIFSNTTEFTSTAGAITAPADIGGGPGVYATTERAGLVELATPSDIRGAFGSNIGVSANVAVTARDLAVELKFRDENLLQGGTGVIITQGAPIEGPGGNPDDPADDVSPQIVSIGQAVDPPTVSGGVYLGGTGSNVVFQSVKATAEVSAFDNSISSDVRLKENVISLEGSLERLKKLEGVNYNFKAYPEQPRIGFIAQETAKVFPEILRTDDKTGMYSLAYVDLIPVLVESIKELSEKVKVLEEKLDGR